MHKGLTNRQCRTPYLAGEDFENANKTIRGLNCSPGPWDSGRLAGKDLEEFRKVIESRERVFVVFSYATPIIWVFPDGKEYRVSQKFSVTTSKHSGLFYGREPVCDGKPYNETTCSDKAAHM